MKCLGSSSQEEGPAHAPSSTATESGPPAAALRGPSVPVTEERRVSEAQAPRDHRSRGLCPPRPHPALLLVGTLPRRDCRLPRVTPSSERLHGPRLPPPQRALPRVTLSVQARPRLQVDNGPARSQPITQHLGGAGRSVVDEQVNQRRTERQESQESMLGPDPSELTWGRGTGTTHKTRWNRGRHLESPYGECSLEGTATPGQPTLPQRDEALLCPPSPAPTRASPPGTPLERESALLERRLLLGPTPLTRLRRPRGGRHGPAMGRASARGGRVPPSMGRSPRRVAGGTGWARPGL